MRHGHQQRTGRPRPLWRVCASRSSDRFWPRHRRRGGCGPSWSGWHNRTGSTPLARGRCASRPRRCVEVVLPGTGGAPGPGQGAACTPAHRRRTRAGDVGGACCDASRSRRLLRRCASTTATIRRGRRSCTTTTCRCVSMPTRPLGPMPSYATLTRVMRSLGLVRRRRGRPVPRESERRRSRGARGAELRGLAQSRSVARGHASRQAQGADCGRRMAHAHPARLPRRPLPPRLPPPVVPRRDRRGLRPRAVPSVHEGAGCPGP